MTLKSASQIKITENLFEYLEYISPKSIYFSKKIIKKIPNFQNF